MIWKASAPSNIALIKYMGKAVANKNLPANPSLSYTLEHLRTFVELEAIENSADHWETLDPTFQLSEHGQSRFLNYLATLKNTFNCNQNFIVRSKNNFPSDCGLASSASSFAALTKCASIAISELMSLDIPLSQQVQLSRQASGSSCRSFFSPWCLWENTEVLPVELPYPQLIHQVIIIDDKQKSINSSAAHLQVASSLLYPERPQRAEQRLQQLLVALQTKDWDQAHKLCWQEFWDMHALFATAAQPFMYMTKESLSALHFLNDYWLQHHDGPLITMDAGPNIHLLYRMDQSELAAGIKTALEQEFRFITTEMQ